MAGASNDAPATFPVGDSTVTWTVTDIHGNSNSCTQHVVVTDNEQPSITCPADVNAILVSTFGGITRGDDVARGLIEARGQQSREVPMVVRIVGTNAGEAAVLLREARFHTAATLDEAAEVAVAASRNPHAAA